MVPNKYKHLSQVDILSIGAGASSLYLGVRLKEVNSSKKMVIIEQKSRIGGLIESLPLLDDTSFAAEGAALRFLPTQTYVKNMVDKFGITTFEYPNNLSATSTPVPVIDQLLRRIPLNDPYLMQYSNLAEILSTPSIRSGRYNNIYDIEGGTGYSNNAYKQGLLYFYNAIVTTSSPTQLFIEGGFSTLINKMYEDIKDRIDLFLNTKVDTIVYSEELEKYIVNDKWATKKIVYTGSVGDMVQISTDSERLKESRYLVLNYMGTYTRYMRLYLTFDDPWWTEEDISLYFRSFNLPLGNMFYFSKNTIQFYADMTRADIFYGLLPKSVREAEDTTMRWVNPENYTELVEYTHNLIRNVIQEAIEQNVYPGLQAPTEDQLNSINAMAYKYTREAIIDFKRMTSVEWSEFFPKINSNNNIHFLSSNYHVNNDWVNSSFACVEDNLENVLA